MARSALDHDRSLYNLRSLQLEDLNNSTANGTRTFETVGKGGFGSIYLGTIQKATNQLFFQAKEDYRLLGDYHGALLAVHTTNEHSLKALIQGSEDDNEPIKVAVKRIEEMTKLHELIREASNLKVLWGRRNFVTIYGITKSKDLDCLCLVMEFVPGCNLNKFLQSRGTALYNIDCDEEGTRMCRVWESNETLWWIEKLKLFREIVITMIICHSQKLYHGDLKGANILLNKTLVPKLVDFGLSFRRADISYLRSVGGSLFWSAPEVSEDLSDLDKSEVVSDPYPSDVYSLGMVLAEMMLDGKIKESFTDAELFLVDKFEGGCPISLDHVSSEDVLFTEKVLTRMKDLIDRCCKAERAERISLEECLFEVNNILSEMFSLCSPSECSRLYERKDHVFTDTPGYKAMVLRFNAQFPKVPACIVMSPSWNMAMDEEENRLVHYFCKLDYAEGVQYILENGAWAFQAVHDIPYLALICVMEDSARSLKYLAASWPDIIEKQVLLPHKACFCNNPEIFQILLDAKIDFDTWEEVIPAKDPVGGWGYGMKAIHKVAASGKTEMVRMILDNCLGDSGYVNTTATGREAETPFYYAVTGGDNVETARFLFERGGTISGKALKGRNGLYLNHFGHTRNRSWVMDALCDFAKKRAHFEVLEFLHVLPSTFGSDQAKIEEDLSARIYPYQRISDVNPLAEPYVEKILAGFETGASEEVISLFFCIEFPVKLAEACCKKGYLGILQFLEEYCGLDFTLLKEKHVGGYEENGEKHPRFGYLLHHAAFSGHVDIVRVLLQRGYSVHLPDELGATPLQCAVGSFSLEPEKKFEIASILLDAGADPSHRDNLGYTTMDSVHGKTCKGSTDLVHLLLEAGSDCGKKNEWGEDYMDTIAQIETRGEEPYDETILDDVAQSYDEPILDDGAEAYVEKILADFETGVSEDVISLHFYIEFPSQLVDACCKKGYLGILQFLEGHCGLDFTLLEKKYVNGGYLLHTAAYNGRVNIVQFLLQKGYSVDLPSPHFGGTPLHSAFESSVLEPEKKFEIVAILLDAGADPSRRDNLGYTVMDKVYGNTSKGSRDLVQLLLEAGFDCGENSRWGVDYMDLIAQIGTRDTEPDDETVLGDEAESWDGTVLDDATESWDETILDDGAEAYVEKILADFETGVSEEVIGLHFNIEFPFHLVDKCSEKGYLGILQFLEEQGLLDFDLLKKKHGGGWHVDGKYHPEFGYPLHNAAYYGHVNIVQFLLQRGYLVDLPTAYLGLTPLQRAVESTVSGPEKKLEIAAILLNAGADPSHIDHFGSSTMDTVYEKSSTGYRDLVRLLVKAGF